MYTWGGGGVRAEDSQGLAKVDRVAGVGSLAVSSFPWESGFGN